MPRRRTISRQPHRTDVCRRTYSSRIRARNPDGYRRALERDPGSTLDWTQSRWCRRVDGSRLRRSGVLPCPAASISVRSPVRPCRRLRRDGSGAGHHYSSDRRLGLVAALQRGLVPGAHLDTSTPSDLPVAGRRVVITIGVRRFRCVGPECGTKVSPSDSNRISPAPTLGAHDY
jgi:hypothetical protein